MKQESMQLKDVVENIISSYEERIENISSIFASATSVIHNAQEPVFSNTNREKREEINALLRDTLAKNENLRKKDFNNMMQGILAAQEKREEDVKSLLKSYLVEQRVITQTLRENLNRFKNSLARGEDERVQEFQVLMKNILFGQEKRREELSSTLKEFQRQQRDLAVKLRELLAKGKGLRIRDFKLMLKEFSTQREERLLIQAKRKEKVVNMLDRFKKEAKDSFFTSVS